MDVSKFKRLTELEREGAELRKVVLDKNLDTRMLKVVDIISVAPCETVALRDNIAKGARSVNAMLVKQCGLTDQATATFASKSGSIGREAARRVRW